MKFSEYFRQWMDAYKKGVVRDVTYRKYVMAYNHLLDICPELEAENLNKAEYQALLNKYAETHEKQTTHDFHTMLKACALDAIDDGLIDKDPTRRVVIKGKRPKEKKRKYIGRYEFQQLIRDLKLEGSITFDFLIYLIAKTGMRFSEALAITPEDFDYAEMKVRVNKTWDYKTGKGFQPTKNESSVRFIRIDWKLANTFRIATEEMDPKEPIFVKHGEAVYNSTVNGILYRHCRNIGIDPITIHGLRHTHASLLLAAGASIASVSNRLGHSNMATTQKVYLHVIKELENMDTDVIMREMSSC